MSFSRSIPRHNLGKKGLNKVFDSLAEEKLPKPGHKKDKKRAHCDSILPQIGSSFVAGSPTTRSIGEMSMIGLEERNDRFGRVNPNRSQMEGEGLLTQSQCARVSPFGSYQLIMKDSYRGHYNSTMGSHRDHSQFQLPLLMDKRILDSEISVDNLIPQSRSTIQGGGGLDAYPFNIISKQISLNNLSTSPQNDINSSAPADWNRLIQASQMPDALLGRGSVNTQDYLNTSVTKPVRTVNSSMDGKAIMRIQAYHHANYVKYAYNSTENVHQAQQAASLLPQSDQPLANGK